MRMTGDFSIVHGSTVATNALLEGKGARVLLITTSGFEGILEIGRQNRPSLYDLKADRPTPVVPRRRRLGIRERISVQGKILTALNQREINALRQKIRGMEFDSLAVCLLASFANPKHERRLGRALALTGRPVSLSSLICPEFREYERTSTTCINAFVTNVMSRYLTRLKKKIRRPIRIMQSNGGALSVNEASREAVRTLLSGPAGGALGALRAGRRAGFTKLITLDMGGTSTDMSLIDGDLEATSEAMLAGHPVKTPMIRINTIGAGGGSLAWVDAGGALQVGPASAGADPGPIAYGRGGRQVTLTDAHLFLGRLDPKTFLGGAMRVFPEKITGPLAKLSRKLRLSPLKTAAGIVQVANANMARALRVLSLERGYDPRQFALLVFGGAGGLHGCELADLLGIPAVLVPPHPGILSAYGMAHADWVRDYVQTVLLKKPSWKVLQGVLKKLRHRALADARREKLPLSRLQWREQLDVRYQGQSYELTVELKKDFSSRFEAAHRRRYGFVHAGREIEAVNVRLQVRLPSSPSPASRSEPGLKRAKSAKPAPHASLSLYWEGTSYRAAVYERKNLQPGSRLSGPALISEYSASTLVPPSWNAECSGWKNLILRRKNQ
jgi:N-methylhydantoinase A